LPLISGRSTSVMIPWSYSVARLSGIRMGKRREPYSILRHLGETGDKILRNLP
jgi:hypothetical protein